jgi:putative phosphoesterase
MAAVQTEVGIFSDTHGWLDPQLIDDFETCDEVWHVGDVGQISVLSHWQLKGNLRAVWGNIDGSEVRADTCEFLFFTIQGFPVLMIHIAGKHPHYTALVKQLIQKHKPKMLVCGHSHICKVAMEGGILYVNPGAAGNHGFHKVRTALKIKFEDGKPVEMKVLELGPRSGRALPET